MIKPVRIQRSRQHKQVSPNGLPIVYVGRPTKWGNPFKVGDNNVEHIDTESYDFVDIVTIKSVAECIEEYEEYIKEQIEEENLDINELAGKNLSCWCKIGEPCHADILLKLANK